MRTLLIVVAAAGCSFKGEGKNDLADAASFDAASTIDASENRTDAKMVDAPSIDAPVMIDAFAGPVSILVEAENYSAVAGPVGGFSWTVETTGANGYSGTGFVFDGPTTGHACDVFSQVATCSPMLRYDVTLPKTGQYYIHVRGLGTGGGDDSYWYGIDDVVIDDNRATGQDSQWHWTHSSNTVTMTGGPHTVHLWARESGVRLDRLAITETTTAPP